jgi:transposase InsO family protein
MKPIHPTALFRLTVLGCLATCERLERGELKQEIDRISAQRHKRPDGKVVRLSAKTIQNWYYTWRQGGIEALMPKQRRDKGRCQLPPEIQQAILAAKRDRPTRSIRSIRTLLERQGLVAEGSVSRSSIHRLLQAHGLSRMARGAEPVERRSFVATHAGDLWQGDVMHGPSVRVDGRMRKVYLVSLMDDASRLIAHGAFCTGETALDIEGVLKQAILKRGLPKRVLIDNGAAYRADSLQGICARLRINLIYARPYQPEAKGKIERWHRTVREQFLGELALEAIGDLDELNARLWVWVEQLYHQRVHGALEGQTPLQRYQQDLHHIRPLGPLAHRLDEIFYHRIERKVRKDGTLSYQGQQYEAPYEWVGHGVVLVVDPHENEALWIESSEGQPLGTVTRLDRQANAHRRRHKAASTPKDHSPPKDEGLVDLLYREQHNKRPSRHGKNDTGRTR